MGMASYYTKFVENLSDIMSPLNEITKKVCSLCLEFIVPS